MGIKRWKMFSIRETIGDSACRTRTGSV